MSVMLDTRVPALCLLVVGLFSKSNTILSVLYWIIFEPDINSYHYGKSENVLNCSDQYKWSLVL